MSTEIQNITILFMNYYELCLQSLLFLYLNAEYLVGYLSLGYVTYLVKTQF